MQRPTESELESQGYKFEQSTNRWVKDQANKAIEEPGVGRGWNKRSHYVTLGEESFSQELQEFFVSTEKVGIAMRIIYPYPDHFMEVKMSFLGTYPKGRFQACHLSVDTRVPAQKDDPLYAKHITFYTDNSFNAIYNTSGELDSMLLEGSTDGTTVVDFTNARIHNFPARRVYPLLEYLNLSSTLFGKDKIEITQDPDTTTGKVFSESGDQLIRAVTVPTRLDIQPLIYLLTEESPRWLNLLDLVPITVENPEK